MLHKCFVFAGFSKNTKVDRSSKHKTLGHNIGLLSAHVNYAGATNGMIKLGPFFFWVYNNYDTYKRQTWS